MSKGARITGMFVFIIGILVLLFVFASAYMMFTASPSQLLPGEVVTTGMGLGKALIAILVKVLLLFVMTLAGSLVAARGIQLYMSVSKTEEGNS